MYCLTQLSGGDIYIYIYIIYYIDNNYMFRHFSLAIFSLNNQKNLVSSYIRLSCIVYSGEVRGEVCTRSGVCCVEWVVWEQGCWNCMLFQVNIVGSMLPSEFFIQYLLFTADTFTCFTRTYRNNQSDTVVNWLLEQFVA